MKKYRVLNLYACLGGNRYKWDEVAEQAGIDMEVTAVELDPELAVLYQDRFPNDNVLVMDAHNYLLHHYKEFDFIWTSPPCPTHTKIQMSMHTTRKMQYPDMKLYQEIIFLDSFYKGKYVVENVIPYYEPLIPAKKRGRHLYWTNFNLPNVLTNRKVLIGSGKDEVKKLCEFHEINVSDYKGNQRKDKIARNLVDYEAGRTIFRTAIAIYQSKNTEQQRLF